MHNNREALERGFSKMGTHIREVAEQGMRETSAWLTNDALMRYRSRVGPFTGNTITGTASGVYIDSVLKFAMTSGRDMPKPVRRKLDKGEIVYLEHPYDNYPRSIKGEVETSGGYSDKDAMSFLGTVTPQFPYQIVLVNGSEYASFIEKIMDGNVLSDTYFSAPDIAKAIFTSMKK